MQWFIQNKEWLLSGIAVTLPVAAIGWWLAKRSRTIHQTQRSGRQSTNVQIGGDIWIGHNKGRQDD